LLEELSAAGVFMGEENEPEKLKNSTHGLSISQMSPFFGKNFVITGTFETFRREELKQKIEKFGGNVRENVTMRTHAVFVGTRAGNKLEEAKRLCVRVIEEKELRQMLLQCEAL
jgi:DNA ligase (NAD+)